MRQHLGTGPGGRSGRSAFVALALACSAGPAGAQIEEIVSRDVDLSIAATPPAAATSRDGRFVAYPTKPDFANNNRVLLHDRIAGTVEVLSTRPDGAVADGGARDVDITQDGRFVAFSMATYEIDPADDAAGADIYVHDTWTGVTTRASVDLALPPQFESYDAIEPSIADDGTIVAFTVVPYDPPFTTGRKRIYLRDLAAGTTSELPAGLDGGPLDDDASAPDMTGDGRFVAFESIASNVVPEDPDSSDVFVLDRASGVVELVSVDLGGAAGNASYLPKLSADGSCVLFTSIATDLVAFDHPVVWPHGCAYVRDRAAGTTELVARRADGDPLNDGSGGQQLSACGRFVIFASSATDLDVDTFLTGSWDQVFSWDRQRAVLRLLSVAADGDEAERGASACALAADGSLVVFSTASMNLGAPSVNDGILIGHDRLVEHAAAWSNYGAGWPGTLGVPQLVCTTEPVLSTDLVVHVDHSAGTPYGIGFLLLGTTPAQIPTRLGGELLVVPLASLPIVLFKGGTDLVETLPYDAALAGLVLYAQVLELDDGASNGVSFTPGLELHLGF